MIGLIYVNVFRIVQFFLKKVFTNHIKPSIIQIETTRKQIGNLQDAVYDISIKINSIESTLDDMTSFIGLDSKQQEERNE